jgi:hypothetical protein
MRLLPPLLTDVIEFDAATLRVLSREGKHREFKQQLNQREISRYTKALAAFSNTDGGILLFGITDAPRSVIGIDAAAFPDEAQWSDWLRRDFAPEISFAIREYELDGRSVVAIGVDRGADRPFTCLRDSGYDREVAGRIRSETLTQRGMIYYRQAGQTRPIYHTELREILDQRDTEKLQSFLQNLKIISEVGPQKVGIVDVSRGVVPGEATRLYVSRETARNLNFIERGRFVESQDEGDPAYVVIGNVQLNQVVAGPLDPADQNLPAEAAAILQPLVTEIFDDAVPFTGQHLAKLAKHVGIRGAGDADPRFCIEDAKVKRVFYTRAGLDRLRQAINEDPEQALRSFASKATIDRIYGAGQ